MASKRHGRSVGCMAAALLQVFAQVGIVAACAVSGQALAIGSGTVGSAADSITDYEKISAVNIQILRKELEIEKANVYFLMKAHPEPRWKAWRYFVSQEAGTMTLEGGLIANICDRSRQMNHHGVIPGVPLENSLIPQMVGQLICAMGDVVELSLNARQALKARRLGVDAATSKERAHRLHDELDVMQKSRREMISSSKTLTPYQKRVVEAESRVLADEEKLLWLQSSRTLGIARRLSAAENSFYILDIAKNVTGAAGNIVGIQSTHHHAPALNVGANTLTTVSGGLIMANPIVSRLIGRADAKSYGRDLDRRYKGEMEEAAAALTADADDLKRACATDASPEDRADNKLFARVELYAQNQEKASQYVDALRTLDKRGNQAALGRIAVGLFAGATKVTTGVCGIVAAENLTAASGAPLLLAGTTTYTVGTSVIVADNVNINVRREKRVRKEFREGTAAKQVLAKRMAYLEEIERKLGEVEGR